MTSLTFLLSLLILVGFALQVKTVQNFGRATNSVQPNSRLSPFHGLRSSKIDDQFDQSKLCRKVAQDGRKSACHFRRKILISAHAVANINTRQDQLTLSMHLSGKNGFNPLKMAKQTISMPTVGMQRIVLFIYLLKCLTTKWEPQTESTDVD